MCFSWLGPDPGNRAGGMAILVLISAPLRGSGKGHPDEVAV